MRSVIINKSRGNPPFLFAAALFLLCALLAVASGFLMIGSVLFAETSLLLAWFFAPFFAALTLILAWVCDGLRRREIHPCQDSW